MIVACENCNTRFNLDENLIKESGSKVRCSKCHHIFTAYKPVSAEEPGSARELGEAPTDLPDSTAPPASSEGVEEVPEEILDFDLSEAEEKPDEQEVALDAVGLEEEPPAEELATVEEEGTLEEVPEETPDFDLSEVEEKPDEQEVALDAVGLEEEPPAEEPITIIEEEGAEAKEEPEEEFPGTVSLESLEEPKEPDTEQVERGVRLEDELMPPPAVAEKVLHARKRISTPLMSVLVLVLLAGGAFAAYGLLKSSDLKIPFLESLTGGSGSATTDPGNLRIALLDQLIKSEFVENKPAGRLFVVKGKVRNDYPKTRSFIMVKGILYSKNGKTLHKKTIYCGNTLSDTDLQTLDKATMDSRLGNKYGDKKSNFSIPSGKVIPFVVVFSDLPQDLGEFSVEVVSSAPG